eukprot:6901137-Lingulodinium_polyedra.AAC.1
MLSKRACGLRCPRPMEYFPAFSDLNAPWPLQRPASDLPAATPRHAHATTVANMEHRAQHNA